MKNLILISLVIFFAICSRSWALPECEGSPAYKETPVIWNNCIGTFTFADGRVWEGLWKNNEWVAGRKSAAGEREIIKEKTNAEKIKEPQRIEAENKEREQRRLHELMVDKCLIKIYEKNDKWTVDDAQYLCDNLIYGNDIPKHLLPSQGGLIHKNIYNNCLIWNGKNRTRPIIESAINICVEVSINPTLENKTKYKVGTVILSAQSIGKRLLPVLMPLLPYLMQYHDN